MTDTKCKSKEGHEYKTNGDTMSPITGIYAGLALIDVGYLLMGAPLWILVPLLIGYSLHIIFRILEK